MSNFKDVKDVLPHREPFLFIDSVVSLDRETNTIVCKKKFEDTMDIYKGHFPGNPITPGVIILEAMAQAGAYLTLVEPGNEGKLALFAGADKVKWKKTVLPNDEVIFRVQVTTWKCGIGFADATASVNDKVVCSATIKVALTSN